MLAEEIANKILRNEPALLPLHKIGKAFAPANIALCKYWGKKDQELNIPLNSSLSIALANRGATTSVEILSNATEHEIILNDTKVSSCSSFAKRLTKYLDLFVGKTAKYAGTKYKIKTESNIPIAAGLASSASGYAALVLALRNLYGWNIDDASLSILARLGSGSAARSLWQGFVVWHSGSKLDGSDSYAEPMDVVWPDLRIGLVCIDDSKKAVTSRQGMLHTQKTSPFYSNWQAYTQKVLLNLQQAIADRDFNKFGKNTEMCALAMHSLMLSSWPPLMYSKPQTIEVIEKIWEARGAGLKVYFTQDAGPNIKVLFLQQDLLAIAELLPNIDVIAPFAINKSLEATANVFA